MLDPKMRAYVEAPLADPNKLYLPEGKRKAKRSRKPEYTDEVGCPKLTTKQLSERKQKAADEKLVALFDYYAGTSLPAEKVAEHMGLYRSERVGTEKDGKPIFARVLDVSRVERELVWRRKAAA